jgi:hypothetical protein
MQRYLRGQVQIYGVRHTLGGRIPFRVDEQRFRLYVPKNIALPVKAFQKEHLQNKNSKHETLRTENCVSTYHATNIETGNLYT